MRRMLKLAKAFIQAEGGTTTTQPPTCNESGCRKTATYRRRVLDGWDGQKNLFHYEYYCQEHAPKTNGEISSR